MNTFGINLFEMNGFLLSFLVLLAAPVAGALLSGIDRKLTAWLQSRRGPSIFQPFYDIGKLFGKERVVTNVWSAFCVYIYLAAAIIAFALFLMKSDLLLIFFVQAIGSISLVIAALSVPSPFSQAGAHRELIQMLVYEPLFILVIVGIYLASGIPSISGMGDASFMIAPLYDAKQPLLFHLPLLYIVLGYVLTIKLRKSPFDVSGAHHAHQELVSGIYTEFSGHLLAIVEIAGWYIIVLALGICSLFWTVSWEGAAVLIGVTYLLEILIDNTCARLTWRWMLKNVWLVGFSLAFANLIYLWGFAS